MRRWLKYGVERKGGLPSVVWQRDLARGGAGDPYWLTMPHHEELRVILNTYFQATEAQNAFYLPVRTGGSTDAPAADCTANHTPAGIVVAVPFTSPPRIGDGLIAGFYLSNGSVGPRIFDDSSMYGPLDKDYQT